MGYCRVLSTNAPVKLLRKHVSPGVYLCRSYLHKLTLFIAIHLKAPELPTNGFSHCIYINAYTDPLYVLMRDAIRSTTVLLKRAYLNLRDEGRDGTGRDATEGF